MANSANSLTEVLGNLGIQAENVQEFINKLSQILATNSSQVEISQRSVSDPTVTNTVTIPSFGYISGRIENIEQKFDSLLNANGDVIGVKSADGTVKRFELSDITQTISDLEKIEGAAISVPTRFKTKNNWFFENFLSPLLYVPIDVTNYITDDISKFEVRRVIVQTGVDTDLINFFNDNYRGKNTIDYNSLIRTLTSNNITYTEDINVVDLPGAINKFRGLFKVQNISESVVPETVNGEILSYTKIKYILDRLDFTDVTGATAASQRRQLTAGSRLLTEGNAEYLVESVSTAESSVILKRVFGSDGITLFENLRIKPEVYRSPILPVNIGYNEREVIFIKPISGKMDLTVDQISNGFGVYTNELLITTQSGETLTLEEYYNNYVSDFGMLFLSFAKEKKTPNSLGYKPNSPTLASTNFKVLQADTHISSTDSVDTIKNLLSQKESLTSSLREIDKSIDGLKKTINASGGQNDAIKLKAQADLTNKTAEREQTFSQLSTVVKQLSLNIKTAPEYSSAPKYRVRGFWEAPDDISTPYGTQKIIQFKVSYRYLNANKNASAADPITFTDSTGVQRTGYFSPYTEVLTKPKRKEYNELTGIYEWVEENVADPDSVNFNQLDIPIRKGESVQIRIKSLSEAGYPDNPVESDWSDPITVDFPGDIQSSEETTLIAQQTFAEETRISLQEELNARGLDLHLATAFTSKDKYYSHTSQSIASGFFLTDGTAISLYDKLTEISDSLSAIQSSLSTGKADLLVSIVTPDGNEIQVTNGTAVDIFAGYYTDYAIDNSSAVVPGKIVSREYQIKIRNGSQTPLELYSILSGGIGTPVNTSFPEATVETNYNVYRRYDKAPIGVNGISIADFGSYIQKTGYQSSQVRSQFIYCRYSNIDRTRRLYLGDNELTVTPNPTVNSPSYALVDPGIYDFSSPGNYSAGHYLPSKPSSTGTTNQYVWNGTISAGVAAGNGALTEFCIHKDHPYLATFTNVTPTQYLSVLKPDYTAVDSEISEASQKYLPFSQSINFNTTVEDVNNEFGNPYFAQAEYTTPIPPTAIDSTVYADFHTYPIKLGFSPNDEFLIGKKTCGAYLFMLPASYASISVEGSHPDLSKKSVNAGATAAITIPVVFQFRSLDKLGTVIGGYRADAISPTNVTYEKTLGLDIYHSKDQLFSFDIKINAKHQRDTVITSPTVFTPNYGVKGENTGSNGVFIQDLTDILKNSIFNQRVNR